MSMMVRLKGFLKRKKQLHNVPGKSQRFDRPKIPRFQHPPPIITKDFRFVQTYCWFTRNFLRFKILGSQRFIKIPPSYFSVFTQRDWDWKLCWPRQIIMFEIINNVGCPTPFQHFENCGFPTCWDMWNNKLKHMFDFSCIVKVFW